MSEWKKVRLGDVAEIIGGGTPKTSIVEYWNGNIPWLSIKDFNNDNRYIYHTEKTITESGLNNSSTKLLKKNDIIISARGTIGELAMIPYPMAFNQSCYGIHAKNIDQTFLYYLLKGCIAILKINVHGSVFDTITTETLNNLEISIPLPAVQKQISMILSSLDDKIELNNRMNRNLEQQAQAVFRELFVDNAKTEWKEEKLEDIGTIVGGGTPSKEKTDYFTNDGIAWITPKDLSVSKNKFTAKGETDITEIGYKNSSAQKMPRGTVLFSSRAPIGYISIAKNQVCTNQGFKSIIPNKNIGTPFVYYFLKENTTLIENKASGSTFKEASGSLMKSIGCVIPDENTLTRFNSFCEPLFAEQERLEEENEKLSTIRDTLLPKLMDGEINI